LIGKANPLIIVGSLASPSADGEAEMSRFSDVPEKRPYDLKE
jgi:hypothetical protein